MTTPLSHYPAGADFAALGRDLHRSYTEWYARRLIERIRNKCISPDRWRLMRQARSILAMDTVNNWQRGRGRDCVSLLDSWCGEAQELADKARRMNLPRTSPVRHDLTSAAERIERIVDIAIRRRRMLEKTLNELRSLPW